MMTTELTAIEGTKDKLVRDLRVVVADSDDLLKELANSSVDQFAAARTKVEARLGEARSRLDDARIALTGTAKDAADTTHEYIRENPWKVLGVAAAAGLVIGFVLSRR
jgi:ElaB/YqjD/DUF883 family membrane-anchored ribosome-binding protein